MGLMDSLLRLLLVSCSFAFASADIDKDVCLPVEKSFGLVPPPLPINFEIKGEYVDKLNKVLGYVEIYYDFDNLRAKYMYLSQSVEEHLIFDYNVSQIIEYYILNPGSTPIEDPLSFECSASEMEYSPYKNIFGYRYGVHGLKNTPMYDSNHVLRFGGPYQYAYNGSCGPADEDDDSSKEYSGCDRGLLWDAFIGCVYEAENELTALVRYEFSGTHVLTSGGSVMNDVDGSGRRDPLSVPISVDYEGNAIVTDPVSGNRTKVQFDAMHTFSWFKANPVFDNKNFQIPPWMHCKKFRGWKKMPNFPMAFSARVEMTIVSQEVLGKRMTGELVSVDQLFYYNEKGLARRDYTPHIEKDKTILEKFGNLGPVKTVYDYTTLQLYVISKATGRCYMQTLGTGDFFTTPRDTVYTDMATPEELFLMQQEEVEYKGQYFTRDIECDVYSGMYQDPLTNLTSFKETYISANSWHFDADEQVGYGVPVKHTIITDTWKEDYARVVTEMNFFKFKAYPPVLVTFDVSECVETLEHRFYAIKLFVPEEEQDTLKTYRFVFLESAQYYLAAISDLVSPLRIQRIALSFSQNDFVLTFAMVEKMNSGDILNPTKGVSVGDAAENLKRVVDEGNFEINFLHPKTKEEIPIIAGPGNFSEWYPGAKMTKAIKVKQNFYAENDNSGPQVMHEHISGEQKPVLYAEKATEAPPKKSGMSPGALGGLAVAMLIIGLAIGIAVMYLYIRKYGSDAPGNDYVMHTTG